MFSGKVPSRPNIYRVEQRRSFVAYAVEIRGNSVAYIIEGGLKTCSTQVLERAASSLRRYLFPSLCPFLFTTRRTHTRVHERGLLTLHAGEHEHSCVHVSRQTRHNGYWETRNTGFKTRARAPSTNSSTISNFGRETLANYRTLNSNNNPTDDDGCFMYRVPIHTM